MSPSATACRLAVLISGSGSNLQAFIDACRDGRIACELSLVLSNRAAAYGLQRATAAGITTAVVDHRDYADRESFDTDLAAIIDRHDIDLVILAGFMRILTPGFVGHYAGRMLNIHPSLLPKYPGLHTHQRVLAAGDHEHGATVHFVTEKLDGGPPVLQARVPVHAGDSPEDLAARVLVEEHRIYPLAAHWYAQGRLRLVSGEARFDGMPIGPGGIPYCDALRDTRSSAE